MISLATGSGYLVSLEMTGVLSGLLPVASNRRPSRGALFMMGISYLTQISLLTKNDGPINRNLPAGTLLLRGLLRIEESTNQEE